MNDRLSTSRESSEDSGKKRLPGARRLFAALSFGAVVAAIALVLVPAASTKGGSNGLEARVVATSKGPLPPCDGDPIPCTEANIVRYFIYVENRNRIVTPGRFKSRATLPNAFVIDSVDQEVFVDGVSTGSSNWTPAPNPSSASLPDFDPGDDTNNGPGKSVRSAWGHWPSTVTCDGFGAPDPCVTIGKPAVIPGESTVALYFGWAHGTVAAGESVGTYVFAFTIHGTFNGTPVELTASSKKIVMT